jgi:rhamnogalacturonyl hydrolase YesR
MIAEFQQHMFVLARFQDDDGMWHEVIDVPGSYAETSATAMIGMAMERGIRRGWLDPAAYQPRVNRAWAVCGVEKRPTDRCMQPTNGKAGKIIASRGDPGPDPAGRMAMLFGE